ncbi:MAG: S8 family serine peptidase [Anaerolineaceae bacterium]|nr:S8 family serine peptidase [Anaerolineaceae bacterium]
MPSKWLQWIILGLLFFALAATPTPVASQAGSVVVRIPVTGGEASGQSAMSVTSQMTAQPQRIIDYGSFLWVVMDPADLAGLDSTGINYQTINNPYTLTLGSQSFDPLEGVPEVEPDRNSQSRAISEAGPHLIQFHGPTKDDWLKKLEASGLDVIQYIHPYTYLVWGNLNAISRASALDTVRWTGDYLPAYALSADGYSLSSDPLLVRVMLFPQAGLDSTLSAIERLGGQLQSVSTDADPAFDLATFLIPGDQLPSVARLAGVYTIQPVPLDGGDRGEVSTQVNVNNVDGSNIAAPGYLNWLASVNLSGEGVVIANVDSGIDQTHPDLINRMLPCVGSTCGGSTYSSHGTHTAGIMVGDGSSGVMDAFGFLRGLGMAPGAGLVEQVYDPTYTETDGMLTLMTQSVQNGAVISGNSWGPSRYPLGYDIDTRLVDIGVRDADPAAAGDQSLTYVLSIMNGYGGTSSQGTPDEAKNIFTIGATELQEYDGTQVETINDLANVTAYGPALDGRTIPHLVAPGCEVDSTNYPGGGYDLKCGTSMASPQVSGSVALFYEKYRQAFNVDPSPALVKAAFLPVAHDLAGNLGALNEVLGHPFDSKQGWGRLNAAAVLDPSDDLVVIYFDQENLLNNTGETWSYTINSPAPITYLHAMLVWTDAPGPITIDPLNPIDAWVNDLDFTLTINSDTYLGNNFDANGLSTTTGTADGMNNTEGIFLENQPAGTYTFTVTAANIAGDGVPNLGDETDQDFALVIYVSSDAFPPQAHFPIFFR